LYRGLTPSLVGMVPYAGFAFYCFEGSKKFVASSIPRLAYKPRPAQKSTKNLQSQEKQEEKPSLRVSVMLVCGGLSGAVAQTFAYPLDVSRRRMQLAMMFPDTERYRYD